MALYWLQVYAVIGQTPVEIMPAGGTIFQKPPPLQLLKHVSLASHAAKNHGRKFSADMERKIQGSAKAVRNFMTKNNDSRNLAELSLEELDNMLSQFFWSARKNNGEDYEPTSLKGIFYGLDKYIERKNYFGGINILRHPSLSKTRQILETRVELLKAMGKGNKPLKSATPTRDEIDLLYQTGQLGPDTPHSMINTLYFNNTVHFGFREMEHWTLRWGDIQLKEDGQRGEYLEYVGCGRCVGEKMWSVADNPGRCPVQLYKSYAAKRPILTHDSPYYLVIKVTNGRLDEDDEWFLQQQVGKNKLMSLMKNMMSVAGLTNKRFTNHGLKAYLQMSGSQREWIWYTYTVEPPYDKVFSKILTKDTP